MVQLATRGKQIVCSRCQLLCYRVISWLRVYSHQWINKDFLQTRNLKVNVRVITFSLLCVQNIFLAERSGNTGNIFLQLVLQHCCSASWSSLLHVLPPAWPTCLATKYDAASWGDVLRKVDSSSTFCNKFKFCCSYYHWSFNLSHNKFDFNACDWLSAKRGYPATLTFSDITAAIHDTSLDHFQLSH